MLLVICGCLLSPILTFSLPLGAIITYLVNDNTVLTPSFKMLSGEESEEWLSDLVWTFNYLSPYALGWGWIFLSWVYPIGTHKPTMETMLMVEGDDPWRRADAMILAWFHLPLMVWLLLLSLPTVMVMLVLYYPLLIFNNFLPSQME